MASLGNDCGPKIRCQIQNGTFQKMTVAKKIGAKGCKIKWHFIKLTAAQKIGTKRCKIKWHFLKLTVTQKIGTKKV